MQTGVSMRSQILRVVVANRANPTVWGIVTVILVAVIVAACALFYIVPPGQKNVVFYTDDAAALSAGQQVRVAGIAVGKIDGLTAEPDRIRVTATVDRNVFIGDQSQVDVRMLTAVGGYYVNLTSLGDRPLGDKAIPVSRVRPPYSLAETLADSTKITQGVGAKPVGDVLGDLQTSLTGSRLDTLGSVIDAGHALLTTVARQRGQLSSILDMSAEYVEELNANRNLLVDLIHKAAIIEQTLTLYGDGLSGAMTGLGEIGQRIKPFGTFYLSHRDEILPLLQRMRDLATALKNETAPIIDGLRHAQEQMKGLLGGAVPSDQILATDLCIPLAGSPC